MVGAMKITKISEIQCGDVVDIGSRIKWIADGSVDEQGRIRLNTDHGGIYMLSPGSSIWVITRDGVQIFP